MQSNRVNIEQSLSQLMYLSSFLFCQLPVFFSLLFLFDYFNFSIFFIVY